jgi:hypothetical protein
MSKYGQIQIGKTENEGVFEMRMIQAIANELAEQNRLKRLELQYAIRGTKQEVDWDLSDRA